MLIYMYNYIALCFCLQCVCGVEFIELSKWNYNQLFVFSIMYHTHTLTHYLFDLQNI